MARTFPFRAVSKNCIASNYIMRGVIWSVNSTLLATICNTKINIIHHLSTKMKMASKVVPTALLLLTGITLGGCFCPREWMHSLGNCSFRINCRYDVRGLKLPDECNAVNYPGNITLVLDFPQTFDENATDIDYGLLSSVTFFRAIGKWPQDDLTIVYHMIGLTELHLVGNQIERVTGTPFYRLMHLEVVDLSHNGLTQIGNMLQIEKQPNKLRKLSLANNAIEDIPDDAFDQVTSLVELDLSNNSIINVNNKTFSQLSRLEVLKLSNNKIVDLDGALNTLKVLKHLYLRGNQIENIDMQSIQVIYDLETFDVSANQLTNLIPDWLSRHWQHLGSHSTCKMMLSENQIVHLPNVPPVDKKSRFNRNTEGINFVDVRTELDLSKNQLTTIEPSAFQYIEQLTSLDLSHNRLITFVVNAEDLKYVKYLNLSSNYIDHLDYESFSLMNNLQNLDLSSNSLYGLPDQTLTNNNYVLMYVNISHNHIEKLANLRIKMFHPKGGVLDLSNNDLSTVNIPYGEGANLKYLSLHSNKISNASLVDLSHQNHLKFLDLSKNLIEFLDDSSLRLPSSLMFLDLTYNNITNVGPSTFLNFGYLGTLRLSHNKLQFIEYGAFSSLAGLSELDLSYNNIRNLDSKVLMDLKALRVLSLRFNGMSSLYYGNWIGHKNNLTVNIDGNSFSCSWVAKALSDFNNGFSNMKLSVATVTTGASLEGIPCKYEMEELRQDRGSNDVAVDDRLLVMTSKILEAIKEQSKIIKRQYHIPSYH